MHLERCTEQGPQTLDQFYWQTAQRPVSRLIGPTMLALIARLRALPDDRRLWGLTSHFRLCLLERDESSAPWYVIVSTIGSEFEIQYLMPASLAPWPNAYVRGEARTEDHAVQMIVIAVEQSGGWSPGASALTRRSRCFVRCRGSPRACRGSRSATGRRRSTRSRSMAGRSGSSAKATRARVTAATRSARSRRGSVTPRRRRAADLGDRRVRLEPRDRDRAACARDRRLAPARSCSRSRTASGRTRTPAR